MKGIDSLILHALSH